MSGAARRAAPVSKAKRRDRQPAEELPVARVCVDVPLAHLDRPFDYLVPAEIADGAQPGTRVRVRFAGQLVDGWLLERAAESGHEGRLAFLDRLVSPEPVLTPEIARLARAVADRYAGSLADVLRLAVPPRHARAESASSPPPASGPGPASASGPGLGPASASGPGLGPASASGPGPASASGPAPGSGPIQGATSPTAPGPGPGSGPDLGPGHGLGPHDPGDLGPATGQMGPAGPGGEEFVVSAGSGWGAYPAGVALLRATADGRAPRAVWSALPGEDWPARLAEAAAATVRGGRGVVAVVPDARDLDRLDAAMTAVLGKDGHVALSAALGPAERYRRFLSARRGLVPVVIGTRAAMFAPVERLGLVVLWDDGDDLHAEPRAPYPHAREVLLTRAQLAGAGALVGGYARSAEAQLLVETGWAKEIAATREVLRVRAPAVTPTGDDPQLARDPAAATARLPSVAWRAARTALAAGAPVLVQVPRRGYLPSVSCVDCRTPARCRHCSGPLELRSSHAIAGCRWCGRPSGGYECPTCGGRRLRAAVTGARRTAEELGRAFPDIPVRTSGRDEILTTVPGEAAVVVATPGAEPVAEGGYGAVLLLDTWALLTRADLRAGEEALRRWLTAAALARPGAPAGHPGGTGGPASRPAAGGPAAGGPAVGGPGSRPVAGGTVVVVADAGLPIVQALLRWDPAWYAARELAERRELRFPPAARIASLTGSPEAVADLLADARLPERAELLGPVPAGDEQERMLVRVPRGDAPALARALHEAVAVRTARKASQAVRVQVDALDLF